ncbi:MAG: oxidoreductase, short-chain dehydrogenase/reductase family [Polyangiaceae bacterium]|jgi:short-subunit dehydrogenase|nr:oxidoreductase, short-chain dehydrogenase/reductase family [Polyangiaceae bacterium]
MTQRVLIIGATSAIAAEVARLLARRGARLHLLARNATKLSTLTSSLDPSARVTTCVADFAELARVEELVRESVRELGGLDTVLIAHGDLGDQLKSEASFDEAESIFRTNLLSVVAFLVPLANVLEAQGRGCLGVITSVAGDRGRPRNYTYGAAKGALNVYLQGLRSRLFRVGVSVVTLKLGPVDTPMTVGHEKNALFAQPDRVAASIVAALDAGVPEVYVPSFWSAIMPVVKNTPERIFQWLPFLSGR